MKKARKMLGTKIQKPVIKLDENVLRTWNRLEKIGLKCLD